ncbi:leucine-rich repeat domain-containing protein [bacterium]|nr:leucine-rich repeat domain-containing protein [Akkermansiaceae bacterium]MDA7621742.1 leucine-rich repeat domain-containing protein [bacterium]MDB4433024.1 leucine-rich repeat domain-containing protein [Akkermansiaceae bacterium]MDC0301141.1 leucine-rich repeat domain-containing protein [Akkermansiaceae bacterium]
MKLIRIFPILLILLGQTSGFTVSFLNVASADNTAVPILDNNGDPIALGSGFVAAGTFATLPGSINDVRSFTPFGEGNSAFSNSLGVNGFFDGNRSAPIPEGTTDAPVGASVYLVIGDGTDLASSTEFAVFDPGLVFGTEDAADFGALDIIIDSDTLTEDSLVYGTLLTNVDTGLGLIFNRGIKLESLDVIGYLTYTTINGEVMITDCDNVAAGELVIPDTIRGNPVTSIGIDAFAGCANLTGITIPSSLTSIEIRAFDRCTSLASITIPDSITRISNGAFRDCTSLPSITIPESVTSIGIRAFYNCTSLASITIPESVTSIEDNAFGFCSKLTSVTIPESVTLIGRGAFIRCSSLINIAVDEGNLNYSSIDGVLFTKVQGTLLFFPSGREGLYSIPDGVTSINSFAFDSCLLSEVIIPEGVTSIGLKAFQLSSQLTSIIIPEGVASIEPETFRESANLASVTLPSSLTTIGAEAFSLCSNLMEVVLAGPAPVVQLDAFNSTADGALAFAKTEHIESYGGDGASWEGLTVREISSPPVLNLESFYESAPNQTLEIDASNFPVNYSGTTYQWSFNGFPIPGNFGGNSPKITFNGLTSSDGSWSVTATNFLGEATAEFDYRVFVDTDSDGLSDYREQNLIGTNFQLADTDGDGLNDKLEYEGPTDPKLADTDQDGLSDSVELNQTQTNPTIADTDQDGIVDGLDDQDGDGLSNQAEVGIYGTSPLLADTDGDSINDRTELEISSDPKVATTTEGLIGIIRGLAAERDARPTIGEVKDARLGSVVLQSDVANQSVKIRFSIEETDDFKTWIKRDEVNEISVPLTDNKKFYRFALEDE